MTKISLQDVLARWAYSEISDAHISHDYDHFIQHDRGALVDLRAKRASRVPFAELTPADRSWLALICSRFRSPLMIFLSKIEWFQQVDLDKTSLATLLVPPMVHGFRNSLLLSFATYMQTSSPHPGDARNVQDCRPATDPILIGRYGDHLILVDGYHRAASLWKFGPENSLIPAYKLRFSYLCNCGAVSPVGTALLR